MSLDLNELNLEWRRCTRCGLSKERPDRDIVFGAGNPKADFLFIYDVPTAHDVQAQTPTMGDEGELLASILSLAKIEPREVYRMPLLGCRPTIVLPAIDGAAPRIENRAPTSEELGACAPRVAEIIYRVDPLLIFALGDVAFKTLVRAKDRGTFTTLDKAVGELFPTYVKGRFFTEIRYDVMPLMSMQQIMAAPSTAPHGPHATTVDQLHKGATYVRFAKAARERDAKAARLTP